MFFQLLNLFIILIVLILILNRNLVYAVLLLISLFFYASFLFFLLGFDFLALALLVIYVGAIAVLFLFVIMTVDLRVSFLYKDKNFFSNYLFKSSFFLFVLIFDGFFSNFLVDLFLYQSSNFYITFKYFSFSDISILFSISQVLYNLHAVSFIIAGFILLVALIGAILLCLNANFLNKKQYVPFQVSQQCVRSVRYKFIVI